MGKNIYESVREREKSRQKEDLNKTAKYALD